MGLGYVDSVIVYNRYVDSLMEIEYYVGTRFDNVRVELNQGANIRTSGMENADSCLVKIPNNGTLPKPYKAPKEWLNTPNEEKLECFTFDPDNKDFFTIIKKSELGVDVTELPEGLVKSKDFSKNGFYQHIRGKYGYTYAMHTADVYNLIPRFEVSGQ
jgi:hypothetical protein